MQGVVVCETICLFLNQIDKYIQTYGSCLEELLFKFKRKIQILTEVRIFLLNLNLNHMHMLEDRPNITNKFGQHVDSPTFRGLKYRIIATYL